MRFSYEVFKNLNKLRKTRRRVLTTRECTLCTRPKLAGSCNAVLRNSVRFGYKGGSILNIQIFGKSKCFDTKKAERYFKERRIKYQLIDVAKYGMSKGEYNSVKNAVGGMDKLFDEKSKAYEEHFIKYLASAEAKEEKLLEHPELFKTPIVRNGKQATVGYCPDVWKTWE